eukprot:CAMPEP_0118956868 /NCGR_PEP_ID=MMETSP1169-20130426/61804_1 /TAXON_ID=36882 /ORGANISM="Pyramimonas obovata, Strain CCMP722" /LENGTH=173 /DNA_ID=CAMNT_0006904917 /DNA_START=761 /DNA_END=1283 /DNA_ORIENTATION=-
MTLSPTLAPRFNVWAVRTPAVGVQRAAQVASRRHRRALRHPALPPPPLHDLVDLRGGQRGAGPHVLLGVVEALRRRRQRRQARRAAPVLRQELTIGHVRRHGVPEPLLPQALKFMTLSPTLAPRFNVWAVGPLSRSSKLLPAAPPVGGKAQNCASAQAGCKRFDKYVQLLHTL